MDAHARVCDEARLRRKVCGGFRLRRKRDHRANRSALCFRRQSACRESKNVEVGRAFERRETATVCEWLSRDRRCEPAQRGRALERWITRPRLSSSTARARSASTLTADARAVSAADRERTYTGQTADARAGRYALDVSAARMRAAQSFAHSIAARSDGASSRSSARGSRGRARCVHRSGLGARGGRIVGLSCIVARGGGGGCCAALDGSKLARESGEGAPFNLALDRQ